MKGKQSHRVVYQTIINGDITVECYGQCEKDDAAIETHTFNATRCEGKRLRFGCRNNLVVQIYLATMGRFDPAINYCQQQEKSSCVMDVANLIKKKCDSKSQCLYDVTDKPLRRNCGPVTYLYLDVHYTCVPPPTTVLPTTRVTTKPTSTPRRQKLTPPPHVVTIRPTQHIVPIRTTVAHRSRPLPTGVIMRASEDGGNMFWLMTAYSWLTDKEFIKANGTHLALAIILSVFIGLVLSLCFMLDHCRRERMRRARKAMIIPPNNNDLLANSEVDEEHIELEEFDTHGFNHMNGSVPRKEPDTVVDLQDYTEKQSLLVGGDPPRKGQLSEHIATHLPPPPRELLESPGEEKPDIFIPPPAGFNEKNGAEYTKIDVQPAVPSLVVTSPTPSASNSGSSIGHSNGVNISFAQICENNISSKDSETVVRLAAEKLQNEQQQHDKPKQEPKVQPQIKRPSLQRSKTVSYAPTSEKMTRKFSEQERGQTARKHSQGNELFNPLADESPWLQRKRSNSDRMEEIRSYQEYKKEQRRADKPDKSISTDEPSPAVSPKKFAMPGIISHELPMKKPVAPTIQRNHSAASSVQSEPVRRATIARPATDTSFVEHKNNTSLTSLPRSLSRIPRKGRLHVISPATIPGSTLTEADKRKAPSLPVGMRARDDNSELELKTKSYSTLPQSSKIFTVPKHKCGSSHDHTCICVPVRTPQGNYTCACLEKAKNGFKECCMTACDSTKQIQKEPYSAQRACSPTVIPSSCSPNIHEQRKFMNDGNTCSTNSSDSSKPIEESGYNSHGTGTDSLCSSSRSTDQEDSQMFQPSIHPDAKPALRNGRSKNMRNKHSKKDPKLIPVTVHSRTSNRNGRRSRYESKVPVDIRPSESSLDDDSMKEAIKVVVRTKSRSKKKDDGTESRGSKENIVEGKLSVTSKPETLKSALKNVQKKDLKIETNGPKGGDAHAL